jgi:hypothetical protein
MSFTLQKSTFVPARDYVIPLFTTCISRAVHSSQTVVTMLPSSPQVKTVYSEANGVIPALQSLGVTESARSLFIDSTTLDVGIARSVAADVIRTGAQMVDAPVSGGSSHFSLLTCTTILKWNRRYGCQSRHPILSCGRDR